MPTTEEVLVRLLPVFGVKTVTPTDKDKGAYVLNQEQTAVLDRAGIAAQQGVTFNLIVLGEERREVEASYYHSLRRGAGREPEPRMGQAFISQWLEQGDRLFLGTDGANVFACKLPGSDLTDGEVLALTNQVLHSLSTEELARQAERAPAHPPRRSGERQEFVRSAAVVELAKRRANGHCEMPGCDYEPFLTADGQPYLEVHHIVPLGEHGEDAIENVAALCPQCHREQHHSADRVRLQTELQTAVRALMGQPT